ncbi:MAG TPA: TonB family protein [Leucothrix sp.]|nr:TonB family protein [Leucothrix sp.]
MSKLRIHKSSGSKVLDKAALKAVRKSGRFPAIPASVKKQFLSYIIPISYRIR